MAEAELARFIDRWTMEYVRVYPHPIERVWRAIIEPEEFGVWFIKGRLDARVGGRYWFGDDGFQGAVQAIEPPRRLRLADDNAGQTFEYELTEVGGGTRMRFVQHIPPAGPYEEILSHPEYPDDPGGDLPGGLDTPWRPGFVGGWHGMFDELTDFLDGVPGGSRLPQTRLGRIAQGWARYASGLDLTAEQKSRIAHGIRLRERWNELNEIYRAHIKATIPPA
jgi:uncharacterized protein YndB with AHSA1/START domain